MTTVRTLTILVALAAGAATAAAKGATEKARGEIGELRYEDAQKTIEKAIKSGTNGPAEMAELYLLYGEVKASLGDDEAALDAFKKALAIDPAAELRDGLSPKIREPFARARRSMKGKKPLALQHRILKQDPPTIAILVQSDPFGMVIGGRLIYKNADGAERSVAGMGKDRIDLKLPKGVQKFLVAGIDDHGNRLAVLGTESEPLTMEIEGGAAPAASGGNDSGDDDSGGGDDDTAGDDGDASATVKKSGGGGSGGTPLYANWMVWGGAAVGLAGVGVLTGLSTRSTVSELDDVRQNSQDYEFSHAQALADKAERRALYTNVAFAAAGACAIVSGVLFWRKRGADRREQETALVPVVGSDGAGVAARLEF
jgi:tetratricopeptide (TPR) repeat protein